MVLSQNMSSTRFVGLLIRLHYRIKLEKVLARMLLTRVYLVILTKRIKCDTIRTTNGYLSCCFSKAFCFMYPIGYGKIGKKVKFA